MNFIDLNKTDSNRIILGRAGKYVAFMHNISGDFTFEITASDVDLDIFGLFNGKGDTAFKINTVQHHKAPRSKSNLLIKGVFNDQSKFNYQGLIKIEKEGQGTHAYQKNQNIILSPDVFIASEPFLEILANDVFCTHGSTTGQLNEEELYYLNARGVEYNQAKELLIQGFLQEVFDKLKDAGVNNLYARH
ncbi:MAG: SufD family Fe-S cluster assembly protein [Patescibacteria group bacterium]